MVEKQEKKVQEDRYAVTEVPASFEPAIQDNVEAAQIPFSEALVLVLNKLDKIEKAVA